jgi:hypothetical protein
VAAKQGKGACQPSLGVQQHWIGTREMALSAPWLQHVVLHKRSRHGCAELLTSGFGLLQPMVYPFPLQLFHTPAPRFAPSEASQQQGSGVLGPPAAEQVNQGETQAIQVLRITAAGRFFRCAQAAGQHVAQGALQLSPWWCMCLMPCSCCCACAHKRCGYCCTSGHLCVCVWFRPHAAACTHLTLLLLLLQAQPACASVPAGPVPGGLLAA